ncbi:MAG: hypothetical protein KDC76_09445 [Bacteroidetes bacterium]|nr:hypothetical protein [Bacteroidota bacterium]
MKSSFFVRTYLVFLGMFLGAFSSFGDPPPPPPSIEFTPMNGGYQFKITPPNLYEYSTDPNAERYEYMWYTDEGNISSEEEPIFHFATSGTHDVTLVLVPRKKPESTPTISVNCQVLNVPACTSNCPPVTISNHTIRYLPEPKFGKDVYLIVPLPNCGQEGIVSYSITYSQTLSNPVLLYSNQFSSIGSSPNQLTFDKSWTMQSNNAYAIVKFDVSGNIDDLATCGLTTTGDSIKCPPSSTSVAITAGPYDPNFKVANIPFINVTTATAALSQETRVRYRIHFQNTDVGDATQILIRDKLPEYLTMIPNSFSYSPNFNHLTPSYQPASASNNYYHEWTIGGNGTSALLHGTASPNNYSVESTKGWIEFEASISPVNSIDYSMSGENRDTCYCLCNKAEIKFDDENIIYTQPMIIPIGDQLCFLEDHTRGKASKYADRICDQESCETVTPPPPPPPPIIWVVLTLIGGVLVGFILFRLLRKRKPKLGSR